MRMERDVFPVAKKELILFSGIQFGSWHTFNGAVGSVVLRHFLANSF